MVGKGHNEVLRRKDPTCHGEMMAIRDACNNLGTYDLSQCELYSTSQPCVMCMGAIMRSNVSRVYYGCTIQDAENIGFRDKNFLSNWVIFRVQLLTVMLVCVCSINIVF